MRVSVVQTSPGADKQANIATTIRLIDEAVDADRPQLVVLPEVWNSLGGTRETKFANAEPLAGREPGETYEALSDAARRHRIVLHGGSIGERDPQRPDRLFNTSLVFGPNGMELARYRKVHLFDIVSPSGHSYRESDTYACGSRLATFDAGGLIAGCAICYDLRFAYLFSALRAAGSELIVLPAAFTAETGAAHWHTLLRARAIETQCWIAAAGTCGPHANEQGATRMTFGHSLIVDPWGTVVAEASRGPGWASARIDRALTRRVRADMPVVEHRRELSA